MYKTAMFGLGAMLALSLLAIHPDIRLPHLLLSSTHEDFTASQQSPAQVPDPQSLAIIAPTVTPTGLPSTTVDVAPPDVKTSDVTAPDVRAPGETVAENVFETETADLETFDQEPVDIETAALADSISEPIAEVMPQSITETSPHTPAEIAAPPATTEPPATEPTAEPTAPAMAPVLLPTPTPDLAAAAPEAVLPAPQDPEPASPVDTAPVHAETAFAEPMQQQESTQTCHISAPPQSDAEHAAQGGPGFDPLYEKHCRAKGVPIVAAGQVADPALEQTWLMVTHMMDGIAHEPEIRATMSNLGLRIGIISVNQATTELPEHKELNTLFPNVDWDNRTRAIGATTEIPLLSVGEENLLCHENDPWRGQNLLVHEFAHAIKNLGLDIVNPHIHAHLLRAYEAARAAGLWTGTYVISDVEEYWAEGVRLYFQNVPHANTPGGQPYPANTRAELQTYDPELYQIIYSIFGEKETISHCF